MGASGPLTAFSYGWRSLVSILVSLDLSVDVDARPLSVAVRRDEGMRHRRLRGGSNCVEPLPGVVTAGEFRRVHHGQDGSVSHG